MNQPPNVQADNASDNKCWAVLLFLAMLVYHDYTKIVYFSFLLVGHTHEDIDQMFSVISRFFRTLPPLEGKTPQAFVREMVASLEDRFDVSAQPMMCTAAWSEQLTPLRNPSITGIQHRCLQCLGEEEVTDDADADDVRAPHTFRITKRKDGQVVLHYKELAAQSVWLPPIDPKATPLVTDPEGMVMFDTPPPDPMQSPPTEVPLCSVLPKA